MFIRQDQHALAMVAQRRDQIDIGAHGVPFGAMQSRPGVVELAKAPEQRQH